MYWTGSLKDVTDGKTLPKKVLSDTSPRKVTFSLISSGAERFPFRLSVLHLPVCRREHFPLMKCRFLGSINLEGLDVNWDELMSLPKDYWLEDMVETKQFFDKQVSVIVLQFSHSFCSVWEVKLLLR